MATTPGILTDWPWKNLGSFKYGILAPFVVHSIYSFVTKDATQRDLTNFLLASLFLSRMVHNQIWISLSRYQTAKGKKRILDKSIEFDQVDRERDWDDQIIFNALLFYVANLTLEGASHIPIWRTDGIIITFLCHIGAVEFLYYWFHRALHHHFFYSRYHSHHHSSIVTEPITSVIHPFAEHLVYSMLFAIPLMVITFTKTGSIFAFGGYITMVDFMNNLGHCNFELIPKKLFTIFPPLKYILYTPSFHSLHHTQFRTNYSLFMPFYDYIYGTMDKSSDTLYETSRLRNVDTPDVVHLTHLTTAESIYHLRLGFASLASKPQAQEWYLWLMWPLTIWSMLVTWFYGGTFVLERNAFKHLRLQTWALPKYKAQYLMPSQRESINRLIEEAILEAEERGIKVFSLGLLNQGNELNRSGELFVKRNPNLKVKLVDGSSLAVAVVLNTIPKGTTQVVLRGNLNKEAYSIALALCQRDIKVVIPREDDFARVKARFGNTGIPNHNLIFSKNFTQKVWVVGDGLTQEDQYNVQKGTCFIPFSRFPPMKLREDCFYRLTPALLTPGTLENVDSCENWLPRRVMSAWRIAGIVHALEGWDVHECGNTLFDVDKIWQATLHHGFLPLLS